MDNSLNSLLAVSKKCTALLVPN